MARTGRPRRSVHERFWEKVETGPGCWLWLAACNSQGYGRFNLPTGGPKSQNIGAHRMAWILTHGPVPEGMFVLHRCDNPPCCRPAHLFIGTTQDNLDDMVQKGRSTRGERNPTAKLTEQDVLDIRQLHAQGTSTSDLLLLFDVSRDAINAVSRGKTWRHI